jgi:hypothetical protein
MIFFHFRHFELNRHIPKIIFGILSKSSFRQHVCSPVNSLDTMVYIYPSKTLDNVIFYEQEKVICKMILVNGKEREPILAM